MEGWHQGDIVTPATPDGRAWVLDGKKWYLLPEATRVTGTQEMPRELQLVMRDNIPVAPQESEDAEYIDMLIDMLDHFAAAVAPESIIGGWEGPNNPWANALALLRQFGVNSEE